MELSQSIRGSFLAFAAALMLASCGGSQVPAVGTAWQSPQLGERLARPVCPQIVGRPTCFVLTQKGITPACTGSTCGWTPQDFQTRYQLPITQGSGQIVAIVDAGDNPNAASDFATYRSEFGLGTGSFFKYNQQGQQSNYPTYTGWSVEIDLDIEMVAAACPLCTVDLIEANSSNESDLDTAELEAVKLGAHVISNSWGCIGSYNCVESKDFKKQGVLYLAATGDSGVDTVGAPAAFASVAAIGGTQLIKNGSQYKEVIWSGASGGCAKGIKKPRWQHDMACSGRALADASAEAGCSPGVAEYDSYDGGWFGVCGTSASSPLVAGVFGLAGNAAEKHAGKTFWKKIHHKFLYDVCGSGCLFKSYSYGGGWGSPNGIGAF
jgi:subtilase family serine protease